MYGAEAREGQNNHGMEGCLKAIEGFFLARTRNKELGKRSRVGPILWMDVVCFQESEESNCVYLFVCVCVCVCASVCLCVYLFVCIPSVPFPMTLFCCCLEQATNKIT